LCAVRREGNRRASDSSRPESDQVSKGAVNLVEVGTTSCNSRTALTVCKDRANALGQATKGVMVKRACSLARRLKIVPEASVRIKTSASRWTLQRERDFPISEVSRVGLSRRVVFEFRSECDRSCQGFSDPPTAPRVFLLNTGTSS
jgi:hypothetical protein